MALILALVVAVLLGYVLGRIALMHYNLGRLHSFIEIVKNGSIRMAGPEAVIENGIYTVTYMKGLNGSEILTLMWPEHDGNYMITGMRSSWGFWTGAVGKLGAAAPIDPLWAFSLMRIREMMIERLKEMGHPANTRSQSA